MKMMENRNDNSSRMVKHKKLVLMAYKIKKICLNNYKFSAQLEKKK